MRVTKFSHACLLVEHEESKMLIDPGVFSWQEHEADLAQLDKLDFILINHLHPDHMHLPLIKTLIDNSPKVRLIAASDAVSKLAQEGIEASKNGEANIKLEEHPHAELWGDMPTPRNVQFTLFDELTHVGDTHDVVGTADVLAMPVYAPWGSTKNAIQSILAAKPKKVIPIHDWFWSKPGKKWHYDLLENNLKPAGIELIRPVNGQPFDV